MLEHELRVHLYFCEILALCARYSLILVGLDLLAHVLSCGLDALHRLADTCSSSVHTLVMLPSILHGFSQIIYHLLQHSLNGHGTPLQTDDI